jgi:hypothetical protein
MSTEPSRQEVLDLFAELHLPGVISEPDLVATLKNWDDRNPGHSLHGFYVNLKTMCPDDLNLSAAAALNQFLSPAIHACAAPLLMRITELSASMQDERHRIEQAIDLLYVYVHKRFTTGVRKFALIAAAGAFDYLAAKKSENLPFLAESILARSKEDPWLVRAILCPSIRIIRPDTTVLRQSFRDALESSIGIEAWAKTNLDSKDRVNLYGFTEWPEILRAMTRKERGQQLEDQLGL